MTIITLVQLHDNNPTQNHEPFRSLKTKRLSITALFSISRAKPKTLSQPFTQVKSRSSLTSDNIGYKFKCHINTWLTARVGVSRGQGKKFKVLRVYFPWPNVKLFGWFLRMRLSIIQRIGSSINLRLKIRKNALS